MSFNLLNSVGASLIFALLSLIVFGTFQWLHIPAGSLVDWLIGIASFWWLIIITTLPWNVYFDAVEVLTEAKLSQEREIAVDSRQVKYAQRISQWAIVVAIALHLLSAVGLYWLAIIGISVVGYASSGATLLLTALRPTIRAYQYLAKRLRQIRQQIQYPREDVVTLRSRFETLETQVQKIQRQLDPQDPCSWIKTQEEQWQNLRQNVAHLNASLEQFQATNTLEHDTLSRESQNAVAQLSEDSQFLGHVREIIRFFKTA